MPVDSGNVRIIASGFLFRDDSKVSLRRIDVPLVQHEMFVFEHVPQYGELNVSSVAHVVP